MISVKRLPVMGHDDRVGPALDGYRQCAMTLTGGTCFVMSNYRPFESRMHVLPVEIATQTRTQAIMHACSPI